MKRCAPPVPGTWEHGEPPPAVEFAPAEYAKTAGPYHDLHRAAYKVRYYHQGQCSIVVAHEPAGVNGEKLWHLSIGHPRRHPTWDEMKAARYRLLPHDLCFAILLPPPDFWVNVEAQDHVFHLWEILDARAPWATG